MVYQNVALILQLIFTSVKDQYINLGDFATSGVI